MTPIQDYRMLTDPTVAFEADRALIERMLRHMLVLQNESNKSLYPDWRERSLDWETAILVESAELIDHLAWKWWKAGSMDQAQAAMEAVDIWHFLLSQLLLQEAGLAYASKDDVPSSDMASYFRAEWVLRDMSTRILRSPEKQVEIDKTELIHSVKRFVNSVLAEAYHAWDTIYYFLPVLAGVGLTFEDLYRQYIAKNLLNSFRWSHGYREGTYVKDWLGQEDNQYLTELLDSTARVGLEYLVTGLGLRYAEVLASQ